LSQLNNLHRPPNREAGTSFPSGFQVCGLCLAMIEYINSQLFKSICDAATTAVVEMCGKNPENNDMKAAGDYLLSCINRIKNPKMPSNFVDLTGKKFSRLPAISVVGKSSKSGRLIWLFKCDCGKEKSASGKDVRCGHIKSCGCISSEILMARNVTHGMSKTPEYVAWCKMRDRCNRESGKDYKDYGGRGIKVCDEWSDFTAFYNYIGDRPSAKHSLDRIDVNGNYEPGNVRWATPMTQGNNTRRNRFLVFNSVRKTVSEWSADTGLSLCAIHSRLDRNWDVEKTLTTPVRKMTIREGALIDFNGESLTLKKWSQRVGVKYTTLHKRIYFDEWTVEQALTTPTQHRE